MEGGRCLYQGRFSATVALGKATTKSRANGGRYIPTTAGGIYAYLLERAEDMLT
jgi:hypothetical protein